MRHASPTAVADDRGYTLIELVIGVALMGIIFAAVTQLFQISINVQTRGNTTEEALSQGRNPLVQLVHDLQQAGAALASSAGVVTQATATALSFSGDVDALETTLTLAAAAGATSVRVGSTTGLTIGKTILVADGAVKENRSVTAISGTTVTLSGALDSSYPIGAIVRAVETVTYTFAAPILSRSQDGAAAVEMADNLSTFVLLYQDGATPVATLNPTTQTVRDQIRQITVQISGQGTGAQPAVRNFELIARPRNLP